MTQTLFFVNSDFRTGGIPRKITDLCVTAKKHHPTIRQFICLRQKAGQMLETLPKHATVISPRIQTKLIATIIFPFWLSFQIIKHKANTVVTFMDFSGLSALFSKIILTPLLSFRLIISEDTNTLLHLNRQKNGTIRLLLIRLLYPLANKILIVSPYFKQYFDFPNTVFTPNWLPLFTLNPKSTHRCPKTLDILFVGRLEYQKNPIEAANIINQIPKVTSTIIGNGSLYRQVKRLNHAVVPQCTNPASYYQKAKILLLSSHYEGFPLTIFEALYFNCLPVIKNLPELRYFFDKYSAYILYHSSPDAITKITYLLKNTSLRHKIVNYYRHKVISQQHPNLTSTLNRILF